MTDHSNLLEERQSILKFLFDVFFERLLATVEEVARATYRLGAINKRLKDEDVD